MISRSYNDYAKQHNKAWLPLAVRIGDNLLLTRVPHKANIRLLLQKYTLNQWTVPAILKSQNFLK